MNKSNFNSIPVDVLCELSKTYDLGTKKHGLDSWREPRKWTEVYDAMMRHMLQWRMGEDKSSDDNHYHMGAVAHRALWLLTYHLDMEKYGVFDDRAEGEQRQNNRSGNGNDSMPRGSATRRQKTRKRGKEQDHE